MTSNDVIRWASNRGYRVDTEGRLISPNGSFRKTRKTKRGYADTNIRIKGKLYHISVHRLAIYQKYGDLALEAQCVRHLDGNPSNNALDNLEIGTQSDNRFDIPEYIRVKVASYASSCTAGYHSDEEVLKIKEEYNKNRSYSQTQKIFNISSKGTLYYILNKR